ncbi:MAG TPA: glycosyltransferase, partial [Bacteroidota bacterium]|nr:glycosyltransferase [Bacteroidota bacterium]
MIALSIVIPAFEEERKIAQDVRAAAAFLVSQKIAGEIIVCEDGSRDRTARIAQSVELPQEVRCTVISSPRHLGKGAAVRSGVLASQGEYVLFADCGLTVPYENALNGLRLLKDGHADLAHGSRSLPGSIIRKDRDWDRKLISRLFHALVVLAMHIPVQLTDTQCGFKMYSGEEARELYSACTTDGFMFDIEIILLATRRELKIVEFPIEWTCDRDSRLGIRRSAR